MQKLFDGYKYGRLRVLGESGRDKHGKLIYECECDCGNITNVSRGSLISGNTKSCGCFKIDTNIERFTTHGDSGTRLYGIWKAMKTRVSNPNIEMSDIYYHKGIGICDDWKNSYEKFREWALGNGYQDDLSIDRIDNDGDYTPDNCRWATRIEQQNNTSRNVILEYNGEKLTLSQWSRKLGIGERVLSHRYGRGYSTKQILGIEPLKFKGKPTIPVIQLDMDGNYIREFPSVESAKEFIGNSHISSCCTGKRKSAGGYKWMYKGDWSNE